MLALQLRDTECAAPVPDNVTVPGDPFVLLTMVMLPLTLPAAVGLNCTVRVRFWEGVSVTGVLPPVTVKPAPVTLTCDIVTFALPVFVIVTFCAGEAVPVVTFPKLRLLGLMLSVRLDAIPEPLRATEVGEVGALLARETLPDTVPTVVGRKASVIVVCCPALMFKGSAKPLALNIGAVTVICVIVNVAVPVLETIKACDRSEPTTTFPKLMDAALV